MNVFLSLIVLGLLIFFHEAGHFLAARLQGIRVNGFTIGFGATITGIILGIIFSINIENVRSLLQFLFNFELFPSYVYFLDQLPSEINIHSIIIIFIFSTLITSIASFLPARSISKMKTFRALKYD